MCRDVMTLVLFESTIHSHLSSCTRLRGGKRRSTTHSHSPALEDQTEPGPPDGKLHLTAEADELVRRPAVVGEHVL